MNLGRIGLFGNAVDGFLCPVLPFSDLQVAHNLSILILNC